MMVMVMDVSQFVIASDGELSAIARRATAEAIQNRYTTLDCFVASLLGRKWADSLQ
jgi:hypothetical protein